MGQSTGIKWVCLASVMSLAGCMGTQGSDGAEVSRFNATDSDAALTAREKEAANCTIISTLQARRSILTNGSSFDVVSTSVLAANARAAESELRSARLRAQAQSKNWLPTLGPSISLSSLGTVIAQIVIDQVLFDNGRRKGEREYAKADVEVAAVTLAQDTNDRVYTALGLYVAAEEAREKAALSAASLKDMGHFEWIMNERVQGGISDMSDLNILRQKLAEIRSSHASNSEAAATAIAELNAMSVQPMGDVRGVSNVAVSATTTRPLAVILAEAEKERAVAEAKVERAGHLPGLSASAVVGKGGSGATLNTKIDKPFGFGTGDSLKGIEAATEGASRKVSQAQEDSNRRLRRLEQEAAALERQATEARGLTAQAKANLDLFQEQYDSGQRQVMDVVGVYETFARAQQSEVGLKYRAVLVRLEMARDLGLLADGSEI